tara:strand:+ start:373 stop:2412 length:2040 start_codon:yes stop_codon:yes gene_type:complete
MENKRLRNNKGQFKRASKVSEFGFVNLSTYTSPQIKEVNGEDWIEYGANNNYFQYLIDRYNGSPTNNAAINGISQAIYGKGLNATDSSRKPNEYAQMISLFKKNVVRKLCYDLKLMGQCAVQVIYSKDRKKIAQIEHMPIETLRAEKANEDGDVPAYYYFKDWANIKKSDIPLRIPAYGLSNENIEIYYIKPYKSGFYYYSPVDYQGGLQYAELEEEVSNYHLNNILNGLAPSMLINFNNGTPNQEERQLIETKIAQKFSGSSNAGKFILAFNDNKESQAEITPVQLSDAHNQYQFLSDEATKKIMVSHRIVSPMLLGIKDSSGLGNNADEIKTASLLMDNTVIRPFQELLIDSFDDMLSYNEISLNLYFTTLQPLEFTEVDKDIQDKETIEEETGVEMEKFSLKKIDGKEAYKTKEEAIAEAKNIGCDSFHEMEIEGDTYFMPCENHTELKAPCWDGYEQVGMKDKDGKQVPNCVPLATELSDVQGDDLLSTLVEQEIGEDYELVSVRDFSDKNESIEDWVNSKIKKKLSIIEKLADFIKSNPNGESYLDKSFYKIRYTYQQRVSSEKSRNFCKTMMNRTSKGVVYRKEDIDNASFQGVNNNFGHKGENYSLFKFKGGIYCGHFWQEELYRMKSKTEKYISRGKEVDTIPNKYQPKGIQYEDAKIAPINMPDRGAYPK